MDFECASSMTFFMRASHDNSENKQHILLSMSHTSCTLMLNV